MRFALNHQNYWLLHYPFATQMPYTPMSWNSSYNMFGTPHILTFILGCHMNLCIMEGYQQIVVHIDYLKKPKYLIPRDCFNY